MTLIMAASTQAGQIRPLPRSPQAARADVVKMHAFPIARLPDDRLAAVLATREFLYEYLLADRRLLRGCQFPAAESWPALAYGAARFHASRSPGRFSLA